MKRIFGLFVIALFPLIAFADVSAAPTFLDGILAWIAAHPTESFSGMLGLAADIVFRVFPTAKAMSILSPVKYGADGLIKMLVWLSAGLQVLISAGNNVTPVAPPAK